MIKANELRLGNWVSAKRGVFGHKHRKVTLNTLKLASWNIKDYKGEYEINPIPLTPEILEKAGFFCDEWFGLNSSYRLNFSNPPTAIRIVSDDFNESIIGFCQGGTEDEEKDNESDYYFIEASTKIPNIMYVHQLQNLYFALTGEELEIKL